MYFQVLLHLFYKLSVRYSAPPADETPPHLDMDSSGGTEREKGTAARRGPPEKRLRRWLEGSSDAQYSSER